MMTEQQVRELMEHYLDQARFANNEARKGYRVDEWLQVSEECWAAADLCEAILEG